MLEEYSEMQLAEQLESLLGSLVTKEEAPEAFRVDLTIAEQLKLLNLSAESQGRVALRAKLANKIRGQQAHQSGAPTDRNHSVIKPRILVGAALVLLFFLLLAPDTPARAAIGRWLGYGYLPYAGFIPLSDTTVIQGPVTQSDQGWSLTIVQGVREAERTIIWVETNLPATAFSKAELVLPENIHLAVQSVQQNPEIIRLIFGSLPGQTTETNLALPGGWQLPVSWIEANQAGLAPTQVSVPFGNVNNSPCVILEKEIQICIQAAFTDQQGTHLLMQALQAGKPTHVSWNTTSEWQSVTLESSNGRLYPIQQFEQRQTQDPSILSMRFSRVPAEVDIVTLHLPLQILTMDSHATLPTGVVDLSLRLPDQAPVRSPTPGVVPKEPDHPIAVPTPAINQPDRTKIQP